MLYLATPNGKTKQIACKVHVIQSHLILLFFTNKINTFKNLSRSTNGSIWLHSYKNILLWEYHILPQNQLFILLTKLSRNTYFYNPLHAKCTLVILHTGPLKERKKRLNKKQQTRISRSAPFTLRNFSEKINY